MEKSMFEQLLGYHQTLDPSIVVDTFIRRIKREFWVRHAILSSFTLVGLAMASWGLSYLSKWFPSGLWNFLLVEQSYGVVYGSVAVVAVLVGLLWLFNDDFERP